METGKHRRTVIEERAQTRRKSGSKTPNSERKSREGSAKDSLSRGKPKTSQIPVAKSDNIKSDNIKSCNIRPENIKFESVNSENIKSENIKSENIKSENIKSETINSENINSENVNSENIKSENIKSENIKSENIKSENIKPENFKFDKFKPENVKFDKFKPENVKFQNVKFQSANYESVKPENIKFESVKGNHQKERKSHSSSKLCCSHKVDSFKEDLESKLKLLEEKEKSIAHYYLKIEGLIRNLNDNELREKAKSKHRTKSDSFVRKMISETIACSKEKIKNDILSDMENNIQKISKIWLKASTDLSYALKNLKSNPSLDPMEVELERVKIHLAIKQTKSLTLIKTRDIIVEAKKLFRHGQMIRTNLENLIRDDNLKNEFGRCECLGAEIPKKEDIGLKIEEKQKVGATGDSNSDSESLELSMSYNESTSSETPGTEEEFSKSESTEDSSSEEDKELRPSKSRLRTPSPRPESSENWQRDLAKKNETITSLNNRIFDLQKTCNEHALKYNQLQFVLSQFEEKIKWNQVLWKQIGKLKDQIKSLSQRNKNLETQKAGLECKILNLDQELERLFKLNHFLNQKKSLLESRVSEVQKGEEDEEQDMNMDIKRQSTSRIKLARSEKRLLCGFDQKLLEEKQNSINQLKTILDVMRDQEIFAQKQIALFQKKIEDLEKNTKP